MSRPVRRRPPPVPWFRGRTVVVTQVDGLLYFKPIGQQRFETLELPADRIVLVIADGAAVGFHGDFTWANDAVLAPVDPDDAVQIVRVLDERLGTPHAPRKMTADELVKLDEWAYVLVEGQVHRTEDEIMLGDVYVELLIDEEPRVRVVGFFEPDYDLSTGDGNELRGPYLRPTSWRPL